MVNIEKLAKMEVTDTFAEILFVNTTPINVKIDYEDFKITYTSAIDGEQVIIWEDGDIIKNIVGETPCDEGLSELYFPNAFQIVRYIDNYLNSLKVSEINYDRIKTMIKDGIVYERCKICPLSSEKFISIDYMPVGSCEYKDGTTNTAPIKSIIGLNIKESLEKGYSIHTYLNEDEYFYFNGSRLSIVKNKKCL